MMFECYKRRKRNTQLSIDFIVSRCRKDTESGCWEWTGGVSGGEFGGYAQAKENGKMVKIGRRLLELMGFDFGDRSVVCHRCDNPRCVNPDHLFIGTQRDNAIDCVLKNRKPAIKLTKEKVIQLVEMCKSSKQKDVAAVFGICESEVSQILHRKRWGYVSVD